MKTTTLALMRSAMLALLATILSTTIATKAQTPTGKIRLRVASYNIQHGMGMDGRLDYLRTARVLEKINADVVAVQEVDSMTRRTGHTYALGEIADAMRYYASYAAAIDFDGGRYGIGILSRQRPLRIERRTLPGREEARAIIVAEFKDYVFAATHLSLTEEDRMASLAIITEMARASRKPFIIAGDMNAEPGSTFIGELEKDFHICSKNAKSWPADSPQACLDYIAAYKSYGDVKRPGADDEWANYRPYVGEPAVTLNAQVVNTQASDHRPIYADIVLPTPTAQLLTTQPYLQLATRTSMNVMFQTNCVGHCWIEYGTDTLNTRRARALMDGQEVCYDIENNIKLDHLQPGTRYYYRVCVQEILHKSAYANHFGGDTLRTRFYSFRTPGDDGDFGCLVFNDLHDQSKTYGRLRELAKDEDYDFVIFNGDCLPEPRNRNHAIDMIHRLADGKKFGKTESGNVWLDRNRTTPYAFYQFWLNVSDDDAEKYIKIFTSLDRETIEALVAEHRQDPGRRVLQKRLAEEVTTMVHSHEDLEMAMAASNILFGKATNEQLRQLDEATLLDVFAGVPHFTLSKDKLNQPAVEIFTCDEAKVFASKGEMRKLVQGGGVSLNKEKLATFDQMVTADDLIDGKYLLVQRGKKNYYLITVV